MDRLQVRLLDSAELKRCQDRLEEHHYLGSVKPVGERLYYVATDHQGEWLALLVFAAAAKHLKHRDRWIGWTDVQRERRLPLVVNNVRFLLLPDQTFPNLGTRVLRMVLARLSEDWQRALCSSGAGGGELRRPKARAKDAKGKIVLFDVPFTGYGPTVAYRSGGAVEGR